MMISTPFHVSVASVLTSFCRTASSASSDASCALVSPFLSYSSRLVLILLNIECCEVNIFPIISIYRSCVLIRDAATASLTLSVSQYLLVPRGLVLTVDVQAALARCAARCIMITCLYTIHPDIMLLLACTPLPGSIYGIHFRLRLLRAPAPSDIGIQP